MTKDKTVTMSRELIREQFEYSVSDRAWFVASGMVEDDTPEGFVYGDFTTDMCWTCYFEARQIAAPVVERQPVAWQYRVSAGPATGWSLWHDGKGEEFRNSYQVETRALYTSPPAPVAVVPFKLISLPPSLMEHHTFDVLQDELAKVGVRVKELNQ